MITFKHLAQVITTDGRIKEVENPKKMNLTVIQECVGGYFELVPPKLYNAMQISTKANESLGVIVLCNEEGIIQGLPDNPLASSLVGVPLKGDVLVMKDKLLK